MKKESKQYNKTSMLKLDMSLQKNNKKPNMHKLRDNSLKIESLNQKIFLLIIKTGLKMLVEIIAIWSLKIKN